MATTVTRERVEPITQPLPDQINKIVDAVKNAITIVIGEDPEETGFTITKADLILNGVRYRKVGGKFEFKLFGFELKAGTEIGKEDTQTLEIALKPAPVKGFSPPRDTITTKLVEMMDAIRVGVAHAKTGEPQFELDEASVELNFKFDIDGDIELVFAGEAKNENVQTIKLTLAPVA